MPRIRGFLWGVALAVASIAGCGGDDTAPISVTDGDRSGIVETADLPGLVIGDVAWPEAIPDDIPVLVGEITMVMPTDAGVRLFYAGVSESAVNDYLDVLAAQGYDLEYVVYETPASGERAQERAEAGEWDAVRATKGDCRLGLEFGRGTGTLDIGGIQMEGSGVDTSWPAEWAGIPAPSLLAVNEVTLFGDTIVEVAYETDADIEEYVAELEAADFTVTQRSFDQNDEIISVTVGDTTNEVCMRTYPGGRLVISVAQATASSPVAVVTREFPDWLPAVPGGDLVTATDDPGGAFTAVVVIGEGHTVAEYVEALNQAGFTESGTMLAGYVLSDTDRTITIYGDDGGFPPLQITIEATPN